MLLKIIRNLIRPHKIPKKIFNKLNYYFNHKKYNQNFFEKEQNDIFKYFGLNREEGIKKLTLIKKDLDFKSRDSGMSSEHEVIFSSLSLSKNKSITDILEIGTFDGFNALLLSNLFPNSNIDTIDLPENDDDFINFYNRKDNISKFIQDKNIILSKNKNINFFPLNSLKLLNYKKKYDLIWIDGAHGYPVVCMDILNSLKLINNQGIIMCDDVEINNMVSDKMYSSLAAYETLSELKEEGIINFDLIFISPGPCTPNEAGISLELIKKLSGEIPIFGVCLGHQAIGQVFGAKVVRAKNIKHGKTSNVHVQQVRGIFEDVKATFTATRYHSLLLELDTLPDLLEITAVCRESDDIEIMGIQHKTLPIFGVQFHPESLLTQEGHKILNNFLNK